MQHNDFDKIFVLDTNVLLHDAKSIFQFKGHLVVIPMVVVEELDRFKRNVDETGRNSRQFSRYMDEIRLSGDIATGVRLDNGGWLRVETCGGFTPSKPDDIILETAQKEKVKLPDKEVTLITKDINLRIKSSILGITAEDYRQDRAEFEEMYSGVLQMDVDSQLINTLYNEKSLKDLSAVPVVLYPNQYVLLRGDSPSHRAITRYDAKKECLVLVPSDKKMIWGIIPKNLEQMIAMDMLLNDDIKLVTLVGKAGTGKTLCALAAGLQRALDAEAYKRVVVSRPIIPMGKDMGYLPGDIQEKMNPWIKPIMDNVDFLLSNNDSNTLRKGQELIDQRMLEIEPLAYIRGRSMPGLFMIVDETQNLTPHEIKTIITRVGEGTKIVFTGDCHQIDNPYVDSSSNGLSYMVEKFKNQAIAGHVTLVKGERSELAEIASNIL